MVIVQPIPLAVVDDIFFFFFSTHPPISRSTRPLGSFSFFLSTSFFYYKKKKKIKKEKEKDASTRSSLDGVRERGLARRQLVNGR